jgi:hypothetical protein
MRSVVANIRESDSRDVIGKFCRLEIGIGPATSRLLEGMPDGHRHRDAKHRNMFRVRLADGTMSDMLNHDRAQELARLWAVTPPVRRKPVQALLPLPPADASTVNQPTWLPIVIVVSPSINAEGRRAYSGRGQLFDGRVDNKIIVKRSSTPFCDGARVLLAEACDPAARLVMCHAGSTADALRSRVGVAAKLTVTDETNIGRPGFQRWQPYNRGAMLLGEPPVRQTESALT